MQGDSKPFLWKYLEKEKNVPESSGGRETQPYVNKESENTIIEFI